VVLVTEPGTWRVAFINDAAASMFPGVPPRLDAAFPSHFDPDVARELREALGRCLATGEMADMTAGWKQNPATVEMRLIPADDSVAIHLRDISLLTLHERQQTAAAKLGIQAIAGAPLDVLFADAVERMQEVLLVDFAYVIQLRGHDLVVRAHVGRTDMDPVGRVVEAKDSIAEFVVKTEQPVVTEDFSREDRYAFPPAVREVLARSGAAVPIHGRHGPFGALVVMHRETRRYRPEDIAFLQTVANVLAAAVDRSADGQALKEAQAALTRSQEQLHQALKMEAVGRLAGGIAHDFNNLLTAIRGYSDMLFSGLRQNDPLRADVTEIQRAADRAAGLTHQLLAFSRRQVLMPTRTDVSQVARDLERMVRRLIGEDIELTVRAEGSRSVLVDRGQFEQVILNMVINARDAMPAGGHLTLEVRDHDVTAAGPVREGSPPPGRYTLVRVEDSGAGIPAEILDRVFEPFFTTKGPGKGTGLGLSTAYGIVKQSGGFIEVTSVEGAGTTFRIYLPELEGEVAAAAAADLQSDVVRARGGETILLVEDADAVRQVLRRTLQKMGYRVLEASNGPQAIGVALENRNEFDLLLTDFVMPHMGGRELIDRLLELGLRPRILIMSGYIDDALLRGGGFPSGVAFIEKPFTAESIGRKVREVLDGEASQAFAPPR
jgi:signal transduction histidine kinase/ActR/RegA family two-component response regulator